MSTDYYISIRYKCSSIGIGEYPFVLAGCALIILIIFIPSIYFYTCLDNNINYGVPDLKLYSLSGDEYYIKVP